MELPGLSAILNALIISLPPYLAYVRYQLDTEFSLKSYRSAVKPLNGLVPAYITELSVSSIISFYCL